MTEEKLDLLLMYKTRTAALTTAKNIEEFGSFALVFNFHWHRAASISKNPLVRQLKGSRGAICHHGSGLPGHCWEDYADIPTSWIQPLTFTSVKRRTAFVKGPLKPSVWNEHLWAWVKFHYVLSLWGHWSILVSDDSQICVIYINTTWEKFL